MKRILSTAICILIIISAAAVSSAENPLTIKKQPQSITFIEGSNAEYYAEAEGASSYHWCISFNSKEYDLLSPDAKEQEWAKYVSSFETKENSGKLVLNEIKRGLDGAAVFCKISSSSETVSSQKARISVASAENTCLPPSFSVSPLFTGVSVGGKAPLECKAVSPEQANITYQWFESKNETLYDAEEIEGATSPVFNADTSAVGTKKYCCRVSCVLSDKENVSYSAFLTVSVSESETKSLEIISLPSKKTYKTGENIDLTGLQVKIITSDGEKISENGEGLTVTPEKFEVAGKIVVKLISGNAETSFTAEVESNEKGIEADGKVITEDTGENNSGRPDLYNNGTSSENTENEADNGHKTLRVILVILIIICIISACTLIYFYFKKSGKIPVMPEVSIQTREKTQKPKKEKAKKKEETDEIDDLIDYGD